MALRSTYMKRGAYPSTIVQVKRYAPHVCKCYELGLSLQESLSDNRVLQSSASLTITETATRRTSAARLTLRSCSAVSLTVRRMVFFATA